VREGIAVLRIGFVKIASAPVLLSLVLPLWAADKFPDYPVRPAGEYGVTALQAGLIMGVQPVEDLKEQKTYFNTELTPKGFVPVFVVIENRSSEDSFLFDKTKLSYGNPAGSTPDARSQAGEAVAVISLGAVSIAGMFVALKLIANASQVQQNILKKEMQSKTLSPGTSVHGFLYIPAAKKGEREKIHLQVPVTRVGANETVVLNLTF
jgi:hypothetical protein